MADYVSPQFVTDERRGVVNYKDALVLVTDATLGQRLMKCCPIWR